jgi:hypothetical protein
MHIGHEEIRLLVKLEASDEINRQISCLDYVEDIYLEADGWVVSVFVEPVGAIRVRAQSLKEALAFWMELFRTQPPDWDYATAGRYLDNRVVGQTLFFSNPEEAAHIWLPEWTSMRKTGIALFIRQG